MKEQKNKKTVKHIKIKSGDGIPNVFTPEYEESEKFRSKVYEATNIETLILKFGGVKYLREELERIYPNEFVSRDVLINMGNALYSARKVIKEQAEYSEELDKLQGRLMHELYPQHYEDED